MPRMSKAPWTVLALTLAACSDDAKMKAYDSCHSAAMAASSNTSNEDQVVVDIAKYMQSCMTRNGYKYDSGPGCSLPSSEITWRYYYQLKDMAICYSPAGAPPHPSFTIGN